MTQQPLFDPGSPSVCDTAAAAANILQVYHEAHPLERDHGLCWYWRANRFAHKLALIGRISVPAACHIIAALSPNSRWEDNMKDAEYICLGKKGPYRSYKANVRKAQEIYRASRRDAPFEHILKGPKVTSFARNILHPRTAGPVTVDAHAYSVAHLWRFTTHGMVKMTETRYHEIAEAYRVAAEQVGVQPHRLQAVTWVVWKRKHKI